MVPSETHSNLSCRSASTSFRQLLTLFSISDGPRYLLKSLYMNYLGEHFMLYLILSDFETSGT
jgi:hypothetical protein